MEQHKRRSRGAAVMAGFEVVGDVLLLQILFLLVSLPLLTLVPAAIALQRALRKTVIEDRPGVTRVFFSEFRWAWTRVGVLGISVPVFMAAAVFSILFWLASPGGVGIVALCVIIPLCGAVAAGYVALLAAAMAADETITRRGLLENARTLVFTRALPLAGTVIALCTWLLLTFRLPTVIPIGSGLVPAFLAWLLVRKQIAAHNGISR
ncbi:DUF624 domain-containing protein [Pseudarthrobacter sp. DSP2-3-2b1]|uniref:DUF624 domain-containing protein n=1 Tax=Pseudarthrobacter sp. DSP2-3-2b1 TaxID=2804661 RepID=UPI003CF4C306